MRLKILLNDNVEEFQFAVHGELKDWREHHTTACSPNCLRYATATSATRETLPPSVRDRQHHRKIESKPL